MNNSVYESFFFTNNSAIINISTETDVSTEQFMSTSERPQYVIQYLSTWMVRRITEVKRRFFFLTEKKKMIHFFHIDQSL